MDLIFQFDETAVIVGIALPILAQLTHELCIMLMAGRREKQRRRTLPIEYGSKQVQATKT